MHKSVNIVKSFFSRLCNSSQCARQSNNHSLYRPNQVDDRSFRGRFVDRLSLFPWILNFHGQSHRHHEPGLSFPHFQEYGHVRAIFMQDYRLGMQVHCARRCQTMGMLPLASYPVTLYVYSRYFRVCEFIQPN